MDLAGGEVSFEDRPDPLGFAPWKKVWEVDRLQRKIVSMKEWKTEKMISLHDGATPIPQKLKLCIERVSSKQAPLRPPAGESPDPSSRLPSVTSLNSSAVKQDKMYLIRKKGGASLEKARRLRAAECSLKMTTSSKIDEVSCPLLVLPEVRGSVIHSMQAPPLTETQKKFETRQVPAKRTFQPKKILPTVGIEPLFVEKVFFRAVNHTLQKREIYRKLQMRKYFNSETPSDSKNYPRHYLFFHPTDNGSISTTDDPLAQDPMFKPVKTLGDFKRSRVSNNSTGTDQYKKGESFNVRDKFSVAHSIYNPSVKKFRSKEKPSNIGLDFKNMKGAPFGSLLDQAIHIEQHGNAAESDRLPRGSRESGGKFLKYPSLSTSITSQFPGR